MELAKAALCTLFWPFVLPFSWEAADVHLMSSHVLCEVSVVVDLGFHALWVQLQVQHMVISDGVVQVIEEAKDLIPKEKKLQHFLASLKRMLC